MEKIFWIVFLGQTFFFFVIIKVYDTVGLLGKDSFRVVINWSVSV